MEKEVKPPKDFRAKHWHKLNGLLCRKKYLSQRLLEFVIEKQGKNARKIRFIVFDSEIIKFLDGKELKSRIKVKFLVKSTEWKEDRWSTDCVAQEVSDWAKGEKKIKYEKQQADLFSDSQYSKSIMNSNPDTSEWTKPISNEIKK